MAGTTAGDAGRGGPVLLCILDGWGWREDTNDNAVALGRTPEFDKRWAAEPRCFLTTGGPAVGLPEGQFGNSEVGHMNLGAGRVVLQDLPRITALLQGELFTQSHFKDFAAKALGGSGRVHLCGLISPGGVHSHQKHVVALARALTDAGLKVLVHAFLDGRDTPPRSAQGYVARLIDDLPPHARVATLSGRYYAMDRDKRWERTKLAFDAVVHARAPKADSAQAAIEASYRADVADEFVKPVVLKGYDGFKDGDAVLCANFRADRVRQIMQALAVPGFDAFETGMPRLSAVAGLTSYSEEIDPHVITLVGQERLSDILGEVVARAGKKQLRAAETEKYPHVTFFFNGGEERSYEGEHRVLVPSPKVATYDLQPEMSAAELTRRVLAEIESHQPDFILVNFANPDMVGHTGVLEAAIKAVETVDGCLAKLLEAIEARGGAALVTADHGNCELMRDPETGGPHTAHTLNPVPCFLVGGPKGAALRDGALADVAPTVLELMGLPQPAAMTGKSLLAAA